MSENNAVYKGFRVSAKVRQATVADNGRGVARERFLATVTITQVSTGMGSRRLLPPTIEECASAPHAAITLALSSAHEAIDGMSTFVKTR